MAIYNIVNLDNETCPLNCQNLKELLSQEKYIVVEIVESGNGWLIKIDDCYIDDFSVLAEGDFVLSGKFNNKPYCLVFEKSSSPFSEEQKFPSYNEECTDKVEAKILLSEIPSNATKQNLLEYFENFLPCGGKVQQIHIESESATITFFDKEVANRVASESPIFFRGKWIDIIKDTSDNEIQKNEVATKTVSVHGVPEDMNLDEPQSFFENGRRSGGGKIEKEAERDESTNVEITSASEEDKVEAKILLSEIPSNATKQNLLEYFENFLPCGGKVQQIHIESESATITFFDKEVANRVASESPIFFRGKWIDIIKDTSDSEIQKNEVATKTVSVHGVPEDMNLDEPQSFFENGRRSGGGKIEKEAERDESTNVEITSASEEDKVEAKILLSEIPSNATKQNLLEYFENFLPCGGKVQQIHIESESATITFFDKEVANRVASKSPIFFRGKWIDIIKDTSDSEIQKNEVATKTVSVHGVPEDMNLDEPQSFFENGRRSGGGKIEKEAERDESTNVEITSASEEAKSKKPMLPARPSQAQKSQNNPEIVLGFLNKLKCNVIVNTTNNSLDLSSGAISKAILADAGPELQQECYRHSSITTYEIAVTSGYNLPCDNVFHISLPHWSQSSVNLIKTYVINCLLKADEMKLSHIAFPALGTGVLGYPIDMVANAMFSAVSEYMSGQNTVVQKITFVIYPKDTIIQKAFEDVKSNGSTISSTKTYQSHTEKAAAAFNNIPQVAAASNKISQDDSVSFDINGVTLILQTGSITDQNVDGIVHGTNAQFTSNGAISESLQSLIGHQFTKDCKSKIAEMVANNYAITKAHSLPATYIVHVNIEGIKTNATQIFKLCFDGAEKHQITSLALPPLGTGRLACSIQYFSKHLRNAVHDFAKSSPKNLKTVKIVIFQREMFGEFCREMKSIAKSTKSRILSSVKNFIFQKI